MWIPGSKFAPNGVPQYENVSTQPKFFDYSCVVMAYCNAETDTDLSGSVSVGFLKHYMCTMFYKDALMD
jgi:hypothetical protein